MEYFASKEGDELADELAAKFISRRDRINSNGRERRLAKSYRYYYGQQNIGSYSFGDSDIKSAGSQGELKVYSTNHYRNLIRNILAITTSQKPSFDCRAVNTDIETISRARLGNHIVDYYMRDKKIFKKSKSTAEMSLVMASSFMVMNWDTTKGADLGTEPVIDEETGEPLVDDETGEEVEKVLKEGDIKCTIHSPLDVRFDEGCENWEEVDYCDVRSFENRWDLVSRHANLKEDILGESSVDIDKTKYMGLRSSDEDSDFIAVFTFYHKPTTALPSGRLLKRLSNGTILYDGPYPYGDKFNIFRIAPGEVFGSIEGYTDMFDVLPLQDVINTLDSAMFTNQKAFGVQAVAIAQGSGLSTEDTGNLSFVKVPAPLSENMPRPIQLTNTPPELFNNSKRVEGNCEKLSGINSVVRGDPDHNLQSGVALQRVQAMAIQYNSNFQFAWAALLEDVGTFILHLLKNFASTERVIALSGKHNRGAAASFKKEDIRDLDTVQVDLGNPLSRTLAGRLEIADRLLEKGLIKTPHQYTTVMETGNLDPMTEGHDAEVNLVRRENEQLMDGKGMDALVGDAHLMHIQEHKSLLSDPVIRSNDKLVSIVLAHIQHHVELYKSQDPVWNMVSGEPPFQAPMPPPPPQGPPIPQGQGGPMPMQEAPLQDPNLIQAN